MNRTLPWVTDTVPPVVCIGENLTTIEETNEMIDILFDNPGKRVAWSTHRSRGAARQRIQALRYSPRFRDHPDLVFSTRKREDYETDRDEYLILISAPKPETETA